MTLTEFLLARIAEDAELARRAADAGAGKWAAGIHPSNECRIEGDDGMIIYDEGGHTAEQASHIARHDPARVLAECEAKRGAIDAAWADHSQIEGEWGMGQSQAQMEAKGDYPAVVEHLALPYADHPDYDPGWRP